MPSCPMTSLREEHEVMTLLLTLMKQEQQHLIAADIDSLTALTAQKSQLIQQMAGLAGVRHGALAAAGFPAREEGMEAWLAAGADAAAAPLWSALLAQTHQAKELNRVNGMLINKHMAHTQGALHALRPAAESGTIYGPSGQAASGPSSRRLVIG